MTFDHLITLGPIALIVLGSYMVFGMSGFGSSIVAMPFLVQFQSLSFAVSMMLLLDLLATTTLGSRNWREVDRLELTWLAPLILIGIMFGAAALQHVDSKILLLLLGVFVTANAIWSLSAWGATTQRTSPLWVIPAGLVGGAFGAAFGTGGPIYTIYLMRRIPTPAAFRATIAMVILASAGLRTVVFGATGLLADVRLLWTALVLTPFCLAGVFLGSRLRHKVTPERSKRLISMLLLVAGLVVCAKALRWL